MKSILLFLCLITVVYSCKKEQESFIPISTKHEFFKSRADMVSQIQSFVSQRFPNETLDEISHVSYINSRDKSYALVFFKSNKRSSNLLLEHKYKNGVLLAASGTSCEGVGCNCQVITTISNEGDVAVKCSCSSCTMLVNETVSSTIN
ncbi:MAG: hypothetical protein I8H66_13415 [Sphingobacteriia bacterium]|nr:hypothetical protein [Sphingobacteriia bacterium]